MAAATDPVGAEDASVWAIGDIHGQSGMLNALLEALPRTENDTTVFLGDYIDRGPDSAAVVRRVLEEYDRAPDRTILLWGNHEDLAAANWQMPRPSTFTYDAYDWYRNGGTQAMESFGLKTPEMFGADCPPDLERLLGLLKTFWRPPLAAFPNLAHVIWVHAGVLPGRKPENLDGDTLLWVRDEFLNHYDPSGRLVIHGHTPFHEVRVQRDKIGIDTGAVFGGKLTALQLPQGVLYQADAAGNVTKGLLPE